MRSLSEQLFWLKNRWFRPEAQQAYLAAMDYGNLSQDERVRMDFESRRHLVQYAYDHCQFYRQLYDESGFHPSQLQDESDWEKVPILEKEMVRRHADDMISDEFTKSQLGISTTGGSTGEPLKVYKSRHVHYEVLGWRSLHWWGILPSDNEAILHRRVPASFKQRLTNALLWWPTKRAFLSATAISDEDIARFLADLSRKKIRWVVGYCATLEHVADYILHHDIELKDIQMVWSTSSPLTKQVRCKLEQAFRCSVMDQYGCCEMGHIAVQRPGEECLTVHADYVHVDIVNEKQEIVNQSHLYGDVVITELKTREFPMIKYRLGDKSSFVSTMHESQDGWPRLSFVRGRISDAVWLPDGTYVDGAFLTTLCDNYTQSVLHYQIHQQLDHSIDFLFVPQSESTEAEKDIDSVVEKMRELTHHQVPIRKRVVSVIPDNSGKRKFIISEISLAKIASAR